MKGSTQQNSQHIPQNSNNRQQRPDVRDNLDSRKNEEQDNKGDDVTHNEKETKENHLKEKNND